jgi:hypothetical protein
MARSTRGSQPAWKGLGLLAALALGAGCASALGGAPVYDYFAAPAADDPWMRKIRHWQAREREDPIAAPETAPAEVAGSRPEAGAGAVPSGDLRAEYAGFRAEQRRALARELAAWIQDEAQRHYVPDGAIDRWATLAETLRNNGDDCDGLELLVFRMLREFGFPEDQVYRAIVYRPSDNQHHMVTLWFEDRDDPWVIDPTGAMTTGLPRLSELAEWRPLKLFSEDERYTVETRRLARAAR